MKTVFICFFAGLLSINISIAAPLQLGELGQITQWVDYENSPNDMPNDIWGMSDTAAADKVGIYVKYASGLTSWATYSGISAAEWNTCCSVTAVEDSAVGFLAGAILHGVGHASLPMAWQNANNVYTNNFDLDYNSGLNGLSDWRSSNSGWDSVEIAVYSSAYKKSNLPEPGTILFWSVMIAGLFLTREKRIRED